MGSKVSERRVAVDFPLDAPTEVHKTTVHRVREGRTRSKTRQYPTDYNRAQLPKPQQAHEKPTLEKQLCHKASLPTFMLKAERHSKREREWAIAQLKALEDEEIQKRRELTAVDRSREEASKRHQTSKRWGNIIESGQIAASIGAGIALLKGFVCSIGILAPSPVTALAGVALLLTGTVAGAAKLLNSTSASSDGTEAVATIVGDAALLGGGYAYSQLDATDRPAILAIAMILLKLSRATAEGVKAIGQKELKKRQAEWEELKSLLQQVGWERESTLDAIEEANKQSVQNAISAAQALKEEEWARRAATRPIRG
ncbi:hypothetical protein K0U07_04890 [bacterium]|nr:hypothetical protein [bacterium]